MTWEKTKRKGKTFGNVEKTKPLTTIESLSAAQLNVGTMDIQT